MIEIEELTKSYKGHIIFDKLNLKIPEGKMTAIYGTSGAGKSTLLNIIGLIEDYDDGKYYFNGQFAPPFNSSLALKMRRNKISYLFQNFALLEDETIEKKIRDSTDLLQNFQKRKTKKDEEFVTPSRHKSSIKYKVYSLSGGEKQRVAIARALLKESQLILADEPTGSLDTENRNEVIALLRQEVDKGKTVVIVTHDSYLKEISDLVIEIGE